MRHSGLKNLCFAPLAPLAPRWPGAVGPPGQRVGNASGPGRKARFSAQRSSRLFLQFRRGMALVLLACFLAPGMPVPAFPQEEPARGEAVAGDAAALPARQSGRVLSASGNASVPAGGAPLSPQAFPPSEPYPQLSVPSIAWKALRPGLELGTAVISESKANKRDAMFVFLRMSPEQNNFSLQMASHAGRSYSLAEWSVRADLKAGINASMYLPDNITSTGYMRHVGRVNNTRIGNRLGAFFVAGRLKDNLPRACIVEKEQPGWRETIDNYDLVVQSYRLVSSGGRILWPVGGPEHSIAAVAEDDKGRILFILSQEPLTAVRFAFYLRSFGLGLGTVMYVEGGAQAGIFVRLDGNSPAQALPGAASISVDGGTVYVWKGRQSLLNLRGNPHAALPNIIGVKR